MVSFIGEDRDGLYLIIIPPTRREILNLKSYYSIVLHFCFVKDWNHEKVLLVSMVFVYNHHIFMIIMLEKGALEMHTKPICNSVCILKHDYHNREVVQCGEVIEHCIPMIILYDPMIILYDDAGCIENRWVVIWANGTKEERDDLFDKVMRKEVSYQTLINLGHWWDMWFRFLRLKSTTVMMDVYSQKNIFHLCEKEL
jgi:hypothetical protein